jgi:hypothetical protein
MTIRYRNCVPQGAEAGSIFSKLCGTTGSRALPDLARGAICGSSRNVNSRFLTGPSALFGMTRSVGGRRLFPQRCKRCSTLTLYAALLGRREFGLRLAAFWIGSFRVTLVDAGLDGYWRIWEWGIQQVPGFAVFFEAHPFRFAVGIEAEHGRRSADFYRDYVPDV